MPPAPTALSPLVLPEDAPIGRESPRPPHLRNARYADQFDRDTLFYDIYRVGRDVVFQGPPLFNLAGPLLADPLFRNPWGPLFARTRRIERNRASEIWLRSDAERIELDGPLGRFSARVQPNLSELFARRRVIHTLSKDNEVRWIADWIRYYRQVHGADGVLFYDNASTAYDAAGLEAELRAAFPDVAIAVVHWPYRYGPQGGLAGAVDGVEAPWDSDYCQTGSMQHARLRFLRSARSVLNVDIDELVVGPTSIFEAAERSKSGFVKFSGRWISSMTASPLAPGTSGHADFTLRDAQETDVCPPKWCVVPAKADERRHTWSVHNLFGSKANRRIDPAFAYCHFKGISNNWKYDRQADGAFDPARFSQDAELAAALEQAGLRGG